MTKPLLDQQLLRSAPVRDAETIFSEGAREIARSLEDLQRRAGRALRRVRPHRRRRVLVPAAAVVAGVAAGTVLALFLSRRVRR